jgi:hypothetical protein
LCVCLKHVSALKYNFLLLGHHSRKSQTLIKKNQVEPRMYEHHVRHKDINFFMNTRNVFRFDSAETTHFVRRIIYQLGQGFAFALGCRRGIKN